MAKIRRMIGYLLFAVGSILAAIPLGLCAIGAYLVDANADLVTFKNMTPRYFD